MQQEAAQKLQRKDRRRSAKGSGQQQEEQDQQRAAQAAHKIARDRHEMECWVSNGRGKVQGATVQQLKADFELRERHNPGRMFADIFPANWRQLKPVALQATLKRVLELLETKLQQLEPAATSSSADSASSSSGNSNISGGSRSSGGAAQGSASVNLDMKVLKGSDTALITLSNLVGEPTLLKALMQAGLSDSMRRMWPLLLQPHAPVSGCTPVQLLEWQWRWRDMFVVVLQLACMCNPSFAERRRLMPKDLQLVKLLGSWCEAVEKQECGTMEGAQLANRALMQVLVALEQLGADPLLPRVAANEQEAVLVLTRACLVVMRHSLDIPARLVGQRILYTDIVNCRSLAEARAGGMLGHVPPAKQLFLERKGHLLLVSILIAMLDDSSMPPSACYSVVHLMTLLAGDWGARPLVEAGVLPVLMRVLEMEAQKAEELEVVMDLKAGAGEVLSRLSMEGNSWIHDHVWAIGLLPATIRSLQTLNPMLAAAGQLPPEFVGAPANGMKKAAGCLLAAYRIAAQEATALKLPVSALEAYRTVYTLQARHGQPAPDMWTSLLRHCGMVWCSATEEDANALVEAGVLEVIIDSFDKVHFNVQQNLLAAWTGIMCAAEAKARAFLGSDRPRFTAWKAICKRIIAPGHPHQHAAMRVCMATGQALGAQQAGGQRITANNVSLGVTESDKDAETEIAAGRINSIYVDPASAMEGADGSSHCACCGVLTSSLRALELQAAAMATVAADTAGGPRVDETGSGGRTGVNVGGAGISSGGVKSGGISGNGGLGGSAGSRSVPKLRKCSACVVGPEASYYCGASCQKRDWQLRHKKACSGRKK